MIKNNRREHGIIREVMSMAYQSLYRKYRPQTFDEIVGQEVIVKVLRNAIMKEKIAHAYLFAGPRGTGKTSTAKIFAQAVNCECFNGDICGQCDNCKAQLTGNHPDIIEMDAASNNGVDEIRKIVDRVKYTPILGQYKVYIIDEVHMLSQGAFNALLKTLEEPPKHVIFILATTEIHKVLPTIISRCQRFDFTYIKDRAMTARLEEVMKLEQVEYQQEALEAIVRLSSGGLRNALTILDQAIVYADDKVRVEDIYALTGMVSADDKITLFESVFEQNLEHFNEAITHIKNQSHNILRLSLEIANNLKDAIVLKSVGEDYFEHMEAFPFIKMMQEKANETQLMAMMSIIMNYIEKMKFSQNQGTYFELMFFEIMDVFKEKVMNADVSRETSTSKQKPLPNVNPQQSKEQEIFEVSKPQAKVAKTSFSEEVYVPRETADEKIELLTQEQLIRLMVTGDKNQRLKDEEVFKKFDIHQDGVQWARAYSILHDSDLVISSTDFLVFSFEDVVYARESQSKVTNEELCQFMAFLTGLKRPIYACVQHEFKQSLQEFMVLYNKQALPEPYDSSVFKKDVVEEKQEQDETLEKVIDLFGERVEVKHN